VTFKIKLTRIFVVSGFVSLRFKYRHNVTFNIKLTRSFVVSDVSFLYGLSIVTM